MQSNRLSLSALITLGLAASPLLAYQDDNADAMAAVGGILIGFYLVLLVITIFFLLSQSAFAKSMETSNPMNNTGAVWIWTQLIPLWSLIAIPVTLMKLNAQFKAYMSEHNLQPNDVKAYNNTWGWVWYGGMIGSFIIPFLGIVALVGLIGFWFHISSVKNSLLLRQSTAG
jgi:heme/copper-type cytochrome/quinol oxidase subunit 2